MRRSTLCSGSILLGALILVLLLFMLGFASLSKSGSRHKQLVFQRESLVAQELARAGFADVTSKLQLDINFPPRTAAENQLFSYTEAVLDLDGAPVGFYTVLLDGRYESVYGIYRIRVIGLSGPDPKSPRASAVIRADFDVFAEKRDGSGPNPFFHTYRTWQKS